jgi:serine/threonine-protein kinase RsbW
MGDEAGTEPPREAQPIPFRRAADLAVLRAAVAAKAIAIGLDQTKTAALLVAITELASNTLQHTSQGTGSFRIWTVPGRLICQVDDHGSISLPPGGWQMPSTPGTSGYGIPLIAALTDHFECVPHAGGTTWRLHMILSDTRERRIEVVN